MYGNVQVAVNGRRSVSGFPVEKITLKKIDQNWPTIAYIQT